VGGSVALVSLEGRIVEVEADMGAGLRRTVMVGLPDSALYQARDRCKAAVSNSCQEWPISLLTINLSPATLPKAGSHYDAAIVAAVLAAQGVFRVEELRRTALIVRGGQRMARPGAISCAPAESHYVLCEAQPLSDL
jgi:magnesium chelatase family protein